MEKIIYAVVAIAFASATAFGQALEPKKTSNKKFVRTAVMEVFVKSNIKAMDQYWAEDYIQHNPQVGNGREAVKKFFSTPNPNFKYEIGTIIADGDLVAVHARITGFGPKPM